MKVSVGWLVSPAGRLYTDMRDREYDGLGHTLVYAAGFPCQPLLGKNMDQHSLRIHVWNIYLHCDYFKLL
jgi:hypothetical protein